MALLYAETNGDIEMLKTLSGLTKAVVGVAVTPVDMVTDAITLGGALTDQDKPYTAQRAEKIMENLDEATKPDDEGTCV